MDAERLKLRNRWLGRGAQIDALWGALDAGPGLCPTVHVHGAPGSGKTSIVREVLSALGAVTAHLGPLEWAGTLPAAWTHIVGGWHAALGQLAAKAADIGDVTAAVRKLRATQPAPLYILLDPLDSSMDPAMLQAILSLPALARAPVGIVFVSTVPWTHLFEDQEPLRPRPLAVHFPAYAASDILAILASERPLDVPAQLYESVLRGIVKPAVHASRQLRDARTLAAELLPALRRITRGGGGDVAHTVARLKADCKPLTEAFCENDAGCTIDLRRGVAPAPRPCHAAPTNKTLEIPYLGKFLILAAFLAASNRASADRRALAASGGPRGRKRKDAQATDRQAEAAKQESVSQGQVFGTERWLQIFWKLIATDPESTVATDSRLEHDVQSSSILHQLRHLVRTHLVTQVGGDLLEGAQYVSNVTHELACDLAANLNIELKRFLLYV